MIVRISYLFLLCSLLIGLSACSSLPPNIGRTPSFALENTASTRLGQLVAQRARQHPGLSGFSLVPIGRQAFRDRIAMTALAEKTLDVQYYIWENDKTGRILAERLAQAADRGVRVRILLDDNTLQGRDTSIATLDAHPHISIRLFNPFRNRRFHLIDFVTDFGRVNHRMHNKSMTVDGSISILGGRNIGDDYFEVDEESNFRDLDILAAGPVVSEIDRSFDKLWNDPHAYPISTLTQRRYTQADLQALRQGMRKTIAEAPYPHPLDANIERLEKRLGAALDQLIWARGMTIANNAKTLMEPQLGQRGELLEALRNKLAQLDQELLIESAYFVGTNADVAAAKRLVDRGIRVRVLTNSLASNDVLAAHAGYEKWRDDLLAAGVEIYELRPDAKGKLLDKVLARGESKSSLHTKAFAFDRDSIFVGSFNLDPRSANINTEIGLYVESPELAQQLVRFMNKGIQPATAWQVASDGQGRIVWVETQPDGSRFYHYKEPMSSIWQRSAADFIKVLPVESQL